MEKKNNEMDIDEAIMQISEDTYSDLLKSACNLLSKVGTNKSQHYTPTRILMDLVEANTFPDVLRMMEEDYIR